MFHLPAFPFIVITVLVVMVAVGAYVIRAQKQSSSGKEIRQKNKISEDDALTSATTRPRLERMDGKALDTIEKEIIPEHAKIVGVIPPVGPWTRMVFSEKIGYIMDKLNGKETTGYWVKLVEMQKRGLGQNNRHKR